MLRGIKRTNVSSEDKAMDNPDQGSQIRFMVGRIQPKDDTEGTIYHGTIRAGHTKIGEFAARVDWLKQAMFIEELFVERGHRGNGTGGNALAFLEAVASRLKLRKVVVELYPIDPEAFSVESLEQWYMKHGYESCRRSLFSLPTNLLAKAL